MNIEAKNITAAIRVIDQKVADIINKYMYDDLHYKSLTDHGDWPVRSGSLYLKDFKIYTSALVDYCRIKYNNEVADFLSRYIVGRTEYLEKTMDDLKKEYAVKKAKKSLRSILTNSPGTADTLIESATSDEIIDLVNAWVDAHDSFMLTNGSTCINIFYEKLNELCAKYNCTHTI